MRKIFFLLTLFLVCFSSIQAQDISFKASAPGSVVVGQQFRLTYTVNSESKDIRIPELPDFDILMGPSVSTSQSMMISGGQSSSTITNTYTYILMAKAEGSFTIPSASVKVKNSEYKSNSLTVKVLPQDKSATAASNQPQGDDGVSSAKGSVGADEIFVRMHVAKNSVYENEGFLVTFKLYSLYDVAGFESLKYPEFDGFLSQEIELPNERQMSLENYNGRNYRTIVLKQVVLYPQQSGKITIGAGKYDVVVRVRSQQRMRSIFDDFFESYSNVKRSLSTAAANVDVKPLPSAGKPASFSGAVGDFKMNSSISNNDMKSNESVTVKVNISGNGNIKLIKNPEIIFPNDFEIYDPKVDLNIKTTANGVSGSKNIEYLAIPRYPGDFTIPGAEFSYFDPKTGTYKTLSTETFKLHVEKGAEGSGGQQFFPSSSNKEDVKFLGKDILYIKTKDISFSKKGNYFYGNTMYILCYLIPAILFIAFFIVYRKQAKENANIALVRTKKANKVAAKRLKLANKFLKENKKEAFYEEVLRALWGYLSDKLSIPQAELTKDNVESELTKYGVSEELIKEFMEILNTCEFARYAPVQDSHEMDKLYDNTIQAIDKMENTIKK